VVVTGTVTDDSGAPLPGATVSLKGHAVSWTAVASVDGSFAFRVPPGRYDVTAEMAGFHVVRQSVEAQVAATARITLVLPVGAIQETLTVSAVEEQQPELATVLWNIWAEGPDRPFQPETFLLPESEYRWTLDLSGIEYDAESAPVVLNLPSSGFQREFSDWLARKAQHAVDLELTVVTDGAMVTHLGSRNRSLRVDLDKARVYAAKRMQARPVSRPTLAEVGVGADGPNGLPAYTFGRVAFDLRTGSKAGRTTVAAIVWARGRPVDQLSATYCVAPTLDDAKEECGDEAPGGVTGGQLGVDALRIAAADAPVPDIAVTLVALNASDNVHGVLRIDATGEFHSWDLRKDAWTLYRQFDNVLTEALNDAHTPEELIQVGNELANTMFPPAADEYASVSDAASAREALTTALTPAEGRRRPTVLLRPINSGVLVFPFGFLRLGDRFAGDVSNIETPLPVQAYSSSPRCLDRWIVIAPPAEVGNPEMAAVRNNAGSILSDWADRAENYDDLHKANRALNRGRGGQRVLFIVAHQSKSAFYFDESRALGQLRSAGFGKTFQTPTAAILVGCGTASPAATDVISTLSFNGVSAIVATSADLEVELATDFIQCTRTRLDQANDGVTLGELHAGALDCLKEKWGPRRFKYVLLGNPKVRLCNPNR
jgi:hypothetical protein